MEVVEVVVVGRRVFRGDHRIARRGMRAERHCCSGCSLDRLLLLLLVLDPSHVEVVDEAGVKACLAIGKVEPGQEEARIYTPAALKVRLLLFAQLSRL